LPAKLDTVFFSVFYPIASGTASSKPKHLWLPRPVELIARGFAGAAGNGSIDPQLIAIGFAGIAGNHSIRAEVDAPLSGPDGALPVFVFSHGAISLKNWYSQYCGELASRGLITVSIEHRDGSGPGSVVLLPDGSTKNVTYFNAGQLSPPMNSSDFTATQRNFRQAEVEEAIKVLRAIKDGNGDAIYRNNTRREGEDLTNWEGRIDFEQLLIGGHSFGATSSLQNLVGAPSSDIPATAAILFDP